MPRILQLSARLPYPPDDGGRISTWNMSRCLRHNGYEIDLICFAPDDRVVAAHRETLADVFSSVTAIRKDVERQYPADLLRALATGSSYFVRKFSSRRFASQLSRTLSRQRYDVTLVDGAFVGVYLPQLRRHADAAGRVVLRQHNVECEIFSRLAQRAPHPWTRFLLRREAEMFRRFEWALLDQVDHVKAISQRDADLLAASGTPTPISVLSQFVDADQYRPDPAVEPQPHSIVSVGGMSWLPNVNGIRWFHENVWPEVCRAHPQARFYVVGKDPPPAIRRMAGPQVEVTGYVADEKEFIARGHLFIVPLFEGSGVRIKILTAMAMGRQVLSTPIGAEGIDFSGLVVRDTAPAWVQAISECFALTPGCSRAAVDHARRHYDFRRPLAL